jgi:hypothetical protein
MLNNSMQAHWKNKPAHNSAQAQPEKGMRLCAKRWLQPSVCYEIKVLYL